ncbi:MAG: tRNA (adenosine(37)-N6)-threonylcarbamoyltransferase complex ATPase subunit type 1 TsaE [Bacteroidales bacterium]|nr:tRNA (adenosine(37)-N6)-threonylcarbamoyltransferase complex ATPase subunit type 1 TsaE [Bacteroidales bacterium]
MKHEFKIEIHSEEDTINLAKTIAPELEFGDVVALYGELGTGKTFLTQWICRFLGVKEYTSSPSYVLVNEYIGKFPICHVDLYRLDSINEVLELGLYEIFEKNLTFIEWAEKAKKLLPENTIHIRLKFKNSHRNVKVQSYKKLRLGEPLSD